MPYHIISLKIEVRFYPLYCAYSFSCEFSNITDRVTTFQITNDVVVLFFLLLLCLDTSNFTTKFPTSINVEFTTTIKTKLNVFTL